MRPAWHPKGTDDVNNPATTGPSKRPEIGPICGCLDSRGAHRFLRARRIRQDRGGFRSALEDPGTSPFTAIRLAEASLRGPVHTRAHVLVRAVASTKPLGECLACEPVPEIKHGSALFSTRAFLSSEGFCRCHSEHTKTNIPVGQASPPAVSSFRPLGGDSTIQKWR